MSRWDISPGTFLSPSGQLAPRPFAIAIILVYLAGFASQMLLSQPVIGRAFVWPFVAAQAVLIWLWIALHVRRLRDAGRSPGAAIAIGIMYVLEIVLVVMMVWLLVASAGTSTPGAEKFNILHLFIFALSVRAIGRRSLERGDRGSLALRHCRAAAPAGSWSRVLLLVLGGDAAERDRPCHDAAFRLWREHEPRGDAPACAGGAAARGRDAFRRGTTLLITADGYAVSVMPAQASAVHGVLWRA